MLKQLHQVCDLFLLVCFFLIHKKQNPGKKIRRGQVGVKQVKFFCDQVLPRHKLENHRALLKMFADAMFQLEPVAEYIRLLPAPSTPQTFPEVQFRAPGTPPPNDD